MTLRAIIKEQSHLKPLLTSCKHCGILFINNPRNIGRNDIGCPFGCRDEHRKRCSSKRSSEYYQTKEGKIKRKQLNDCRKNKNSQNQNQDLNKPKDTKNPLVHTYLLHIQLIISLIEKRHIEIEIISKIIAELKQHSIDFLKKPLYKHFYNQKEPP